MAVSWMGLTRLLKAVDVNTIRQMPVAVWMMESMLCSSAAHLMVYTTLTKGGLPYGGELQMLKWTMSRLMTMVSYFDLKLDGY